MSKEVEIITKDSLLSYQPDYYRNSDVMANINNTNAIELETLNTSIKDTGNQMLIDTATTSLFRWETNLGLSILNNYANEYRRSIILARLRGQGTTTVVMLKNVAESFENGEVDIIEDNANYSFTVKFVGQKGIPPNLNDLKKAIEELKPCHLGVNYIFAYLLWSEFDNYNKTWSQWDNLNLNWNTFETYKE